VANSLLDISYITNEALIVLENDLVIADKVNRQYSDEFAVAGAKIGYTVNVRRPPRYKGTFGPGLNVEDTVETFSPVTLTSQFHVDVQFTTADLALAMDMFKKRVLKPMIAAVANRLDSDTYQYLYQNTGNSIGTPGISPASYLLFAQAKSVLRNESAPFDDEYFCVMDPLSMAVATDSIKGLFNPQAQIGEAVSRGLIANRFAGLDWYEDQNIASVPLSAGTGLGTPVLGTLTNSTNLGLTTGWANTATIYTTGWTNSTAVVQVGDVIQLAGVYPVNPQSRNQYGRTLKQFVVIPPNGYATSYGTAITGVAYNASTLSAGTFNAATGVYTSNGSGQLYISIAEAPITGGQFQNCVANTALSTSTAITVNNGISAAVNSPQSMVFHRDALALAIADLPLPRGVEMAARSVDADENLSIRMVSQYTINNDAIPTRCDILYGATSLYRQLGVRIAG